MGNHRIGPPPITPAPPRQAARAFPGRADQVRTARRFLAGLLGASPTADNAILLISEIATNAVAHSASGVPGGTFIVRARVSDDGCLHAEVEDQGSGWDGNLGTAEAPHGLFLLRALSASCGTRRGEHGWVTWFSLPVPVAGTARSARQASPGSTGPPAW